MATTRLRYGDRPQGYPAPPTRRRRVVVMRPRLAVTISADPPASPVRLETAHESRTAGLAVQDSRHVGELGHHPPGLVVGVVAVQHPAAGVGGVEVDRHTFSGPHNHGVLARPGITGSDPPQLEG